MNEPAPLDRLASEIRYYTEQMQINKLKANNLRKKLKQLQKQENKGLSNERITGNK